VPEPVILSLGLGVLGSYLANRLEQSQRGIVETIENRLRDGRLPANHEVADACRTALKQALRMLAQTMDIHVAAPRSLKEAFANRHDSEGRWKPLLEWWHNAEKEWFHEFLGEIESNETLDQFDLGAAMNSQNLNQAARNRGASDVAPLFHAAMLDWTERRVQHGKRPEFFAEWIRDGWPLADDSPGIRVTLYQVWCLFFQDHLKHNEGVFRILTTEWLGCLDERLEKLVVAPGQLQQWLDSQLGEPRQMLEQLHSAVSVLTASAVKCDDRVGQLMALFVAFRDEIRDERYFLADELRAIDDRLSTVDAATGRIEGKIDSARQSTIALHPKVDALAGKMDAIQNWLAERSTQERSSRDSTRTESFSKDWGTTGLPPKYLVWQGTFVGRSRQLQTLAEQISAGIIVPIAGQPNAGKTSLLCRFISSEESRSALARANVSAGRLPIGVCYVDLSWFQFCPFPVLRGLATALGVAKATDLSLSERQLRVNLLADVMPSASSRPN
jgi:hypothetical protein